MTRVLLSVWMSLIFVATGQAAIIVQVQNSQINAGGTGYVDVLLKGDPGDTLGRYGYEFEITGATAQSGDLQFAATQSDSEQTETLPHPYVFLGDTDPTYFYSARGGGGLDPATLVGSDLLATGNDVSIDGTFLLARLELQHLGTMATGSHNFTVSLKLPSSFTEFDRDWDSGTANSYDALTEVLASPGTVTVLNNAAVPEPTSLMIFGMGTLGIGLCRRYRTRQRVPMHESNGPV